MSQARLERPARSSSRFAGVTRVGFRVVVMAGLAGAAWALSASAANAAEASVHSTTDAPQQSSLTILVNDLGAGLLGAPIGESDAIPAPGSHDGLLGPAGNTVKPLLQVGNGVLAQVLAPNQLVLSHNSMSRSASAATGHANGPAHLAAVASAGTAALAPIINQVMAGTPVRPDGLIDESRSGSLDLVRTVTSLVAPLGLGQIPQPTLDEIQPMIGIIDPLIAPIDQLLGPIAGVVDDVATPIFDGLEPIPAPMDDVVTRSTDGLSSTTTAGSVSDYSETAASMPSVPAASSTPTTAGLYPVRVDRESSVQRATNRQGTRGATTRRLVLKPNRRDTPVSPVPTPALPAPSPGGISTTGSGSLSGDGGIAIVPAPAERIAAMLLRSANAARFAVRRFIIENPVVSPD